MFSLERWQEIFQAIAKNKLRTFLTGVSVASGIFILVILLGVGKGLENGISRVFSRDAETRISVRTGVTTKEFKGLNPGRRIQLRNGDFDFISRYYSDILEYKSPVYQVWSASMVHGNETGSYRCEGVWPDFQFIENASLVEGRFINYSDLKYREKFAVIGYKVRSDLFPEMESPLGKDLKVNNTVFKVVGVFSDPGGEREEARIFIPLSTAQQVFSAGDQIRNISMTLPMSDSYDEALFRSLAFTDKISSFLKERHRIDPEDASAIVISNTLETAKRFYDLNAIIKIFFWGVGICTIIAGIVGVGNIMLIIVKERTKEIGIRKALGATPISIVSMILQEAIFVTTLSGFSGLILGLFLLEIIGPKIDSDFFYKPEVDFNIAITTVFLLVGAGALAGFFPAFRAAKIKPIEALNDV
jgi:putative ABC transport system permease protein